MSHFYCLNSSLPIMYGVYYSNECYCWWTNVRSTDCCWVFLPRKYQYKFRQNVALYSNYSYYYHKMLTIRHQILQCHLKIEKRQYHDCFLSLYSIWTLQHMNISIIVLHAGNQNKELIITAKITLVNAGIYCHVNNIVSPLCIPKIYNKLHNLVYTGWSDQV